MESYEVIITVIEDNNCPVYDQGDEFKLSGRLLLLPHEKAACIIFVLDITESYLNSEGPEKYHINSPTGYFTCTGPETGCTGSIRLKYETISPDDVRKNNEESSTIVRLLSNFSIFKDLKENKIKELVSFLKIRQFDKGGIIINKGDPGVKLYIIMSGKVEVLGDDGVSIAFLKKGDVFGEMSLLSGDPVAATIKVVEPATVLYIDGRDFRKVLQKFPSLQMYFARLLAKRLALTNSLRADDLTSAMTGKLSEIAPTELFQTLHQNQKTGMLRLHLSGGEAEILFREGNIIHAGYGEKEDRDAFFELLKEKKGRFKFTPGLSPEKMKYPEIGDFMWLLMEGLNRIDEG